MQKPQDIVDSILEIGRKVMPEELTETIRDNSLAMMRSKLEELDMVSREEFDIQTAVLAKTRARLEMLEEKVRQLEASSSQSVDQSTSDQSGD